MKRQILQLGREIGSRLRYHRKNAGFSQLVCATRAGLSQPHYQAIESGRRLPRVDTLQKICRVFDLRLHQLFEEVGL